MHRPHPVRAARRWSRRRKAITGTGVLMLSGVSLIVIEAALGFSGPGSAQPVGSADGIVGSGIGAPLRLVVVGDSTGVAVGAGSVTSGYPYLVATRLARDIGRPVDLHVLAVSGARVADVLAVQVPQLAALRPDVTLVVVGGNDVVHLTNQEDARRDLHSVIQRASAVSRGVVVSGVPAMGTIRRVAQPLRALIGLIGQRYDSIWRDETANAGIARIELADKTRQPFSDDSSLLSGDGFHPSAKGYVVWADAIEPVVLSVAASLTRSDVAS